MRVHVLVYIHELFWMCVCVCVCMCVHCTCTCVSHGLRGVHGSGGGCGQWHSRQCLVQCDIESAGIWLPPIVMPHLPELAGGQRSL